MKRLLISVLRFYHIYWMLAVAALMTLGLGWHLDRQFGSAAYNDLLYIGFILLSLLVAGLALRYKQARAEQLLERLGGVTKELYRMNQQEAMTNRYLGITTHDIRNPLQIIKGCAEMLQLADSGLKPSHGKFLNAIEESGERIHVLVEEMLRIQEQSEMGIAVELKNMRVHNILDNLIMGYQLLANKKNVTIEFEDDIRDQWFQIDKTIFLQVADNLISNAVKYSPPGGRVAVELSSDDEGHLILCVKDEGVGIKPEEMEHLFNRYSRLSSRPTAGESSTGLGLSIVKDQMDAINGKLWCESVYGEGAMFFAEFTQNKNRDDMG